MDTKRAKEIVESYFREGADVRMTLLGASSDQVVKAADLVAESMARGGKLLLCGNGGSAADCQHMATEFTCRLTKDFLRPALPAIALTTDTSCLTAYSNDCGFDGVFARQIEALGREGDVLLGLSTSGGSENIVRAVEAARAKKMVVITLCGEGGKLVALSDVAITVPCKNNQIVQECHLAIEHMICHLVERKMFP